MGQVNKKRALPPITLKDSGRWKLSPEAKAVLARMEVKNGKRNADRNSQK